MQQTIKDQGVVGQISGVDRRGLHANGGIPFTYWHNDYHFVTRRLGMGNEIYDWIGQMTSHALQLGDEARPLRYRDAKRHDLILSLRIERNGNIVQITGSRLEDSLLVEYTFRISDLLDVTEREIQEHADSMNTTVKGAREDIEETIRAQKLNQIGEDRLQEAFDSAEDQLREIDSSINWLHFSEDNPMWDGFAVQDRIYPDESGVSLEAYNETVKQVVHDGRPIAQAVYNALDELGEEAVPAESESEQSTTADRMYE